MKKKLLNFVEAAVFLLILGTCLFAAVLVLRRKESSYKYADFFDKAKEEQIDVLFMGSSHVINGINPVVLYDEYGYTSYNMGGHGSVMQATYWELIEALDYCCPKWVFVDAYMLEKDYQYLDVMEENADADALNTSIEQLHLNMDVWPLNRLKIAAINDLILDKDKKNQFLFDFIVYHDRWKELGADDYAVLSGKESRNALYGAEMRYDVELSPIISSDPEPGQGLDSHTVGQEYLMKIIDECQRRGIGVAVTYLPFCATYEDKKAANSAGMIAERYGVPFINMLDAGIIDIRSDLNDTGHLNVSGAYRVTECLGEWLYEYAELTDHRGDPAYSDWDEHVRNFYAEARNRIDGEEDLYRELGLLSLNNVGYVVYFNQGSEVFSDDGIRYMISRMAGTDAIYTTQGPYIFIYDTGSGAKYEAFGQGSLDGVPTALGTIVYQPVEERFRFLYTLENQEYNYLYDDDHVAYDIQILTYDRDTGEMLSHRYYRSFGSNFRVD